MGSPSCLNSKESACRCRRRGFDLWAANIPLEEELATHSSIPAWESHGQWSLARLQSTGVMKNRDTTELAGYTLGHFHSSLPCICEIKFSCAFSAGSSVSHPSHS